MHITRAATRVLGLAVAVPALVAALTACGGSGTVTASGTAGPAGLSTSSAATSPAGAAATAPPSGSSAGSSGSSGGGSGSGSGKHGCPAGGTAIPAGAGRATTADLDGDGRADTIWLADAGQVRELGVRTATGAGFSTAFDSAAPLAASAEAGLVQGGVPVILLDTGRSAQVYTVADCHLVATRNAQGRQYTFDRGFTGYGTGAGCPVIGDSRRLVGYLAKNAGPGTRFTVTRTLVNLTDGGRRAGNGTTTTLGTSLSAGSPTVKAALSFTCGSGGTAHEPQS
jgi:hypothetical protein